MMKFMCAALGAIVSLLFAGHGIAQGDRQGEVKQYAVSGLGDVIAEQRSRSAYAWEGQFEVDGVKGDLFDIPTRNGAVVILRLDDGRIIHRLPGLNGGESVLVSHPGDVAPCRVPAPGPDRRDQPPGQSRMGACDDGSIIDLLVKWTPTAAAETGGYVQIRSLAEACISFTNHVYAQSGISTRLRAVGYGVTEDYSGDATDQDLIYKITDPGDGVLDKLHAERDALGADLVAVLQGDSNFYGGLAWIFQGPSRDDLGFSLTVWDRAIAGLTFSHEIGHNQGCCHAVGDGGGCDDGGYFTYSNGHRPVIGGYNYATVMAYYASQTIFRAPRFSNPGIVFENVPTGVSGDSENARTINETALDVANFRCAVVPDDGSVAHLMSGSLDLPGQEGGTIEVLFTDVAPAEANGVVTISFNGMHSGFRAYDVQFGSLNLGTISSSQNSACRTLSDSRQLVSGIFNDQLGSDRSLVIRISLDPISLAVPCEDLGIMVTYVAEGECTPGSPDSDDDGTPDCNDGCPDDPDKVDVGLCGCGISDVDSDLDGTPDCSDGCPNDVGKTDPGICGCGESDEDLDENGVPDCIDDGDVQTIVVDDDLQQAPNADYTTIQGAVDAALDGATILVQPGRYTSSADNVVFIQGKGVQLIGVGGYAETIIDCEDARGGIRCELTTASDLIIQGITVQSHSTCFSAGGSPPSCSAGVLVVAYPNSNVLVDSCVVRDGSGFALRVEGRFNLPHSGGDIVVRDSMVLGNTGPSGSSADWLMTSSYCSPRFESCAVIGNTAGQMLLSYYSGPNFTDCSFVANDLIPVTGPYSGAIFYHDMGSPGNVMRVEGCRFVECSGACVVQGGDGDGVQFTDSFACDSSGAPTLCGTYNQVDIVLTDDCPELDCNENGVTDAIEIFEGALADVDGDGIPDCCQSGSSCSCIGDLNDDGVVNGVDLASLLSAWGNPDAFPAADIDGDGEVNGVDLAYVLTAWGSCEG